ncbi:MAG TPA: 23S rRNA (adenine(2503)-C(2))-methyltransferase RlmN [Desulfovibrio sp.]|jgi:23S rRNA (adenine2503-C2)-methyltransferase|nr:23S rRNA (adenine(2503)-C(2))-methyltransferase RlmN [Desulfovibrio sp.]
MINLLDLTLSELEAFCVEDLREPRFRAAQVWQWIWQKEARDISAMTNLSRALREKLAARAEARWPDVSLVRTSSDGTIKFLLELADGRLIESVLIPGGKLERYTLCLSTQVGCPMACTFCNTGLMGFERNLTQAEILGQVLVARAHLAATGSAPLTNLVFMGMGEPLLNLDWLLKSLATLNSDTGLNLSWRRTTVSSVGLPKGLEVLGASGLALPAISLHAPSQELRARIMPKAAQVPLDELLAALDRYPMKPRERITFEYLLLKGVNDSPAHARQLHKLLCNRRCKVNLIAYNATEGSPYEAPDPEAVLAFEKFLWDKGMTATIRRSMGTDIKAACGQLKAETLRG